MKLLSIGAALAVLSFAAPALAQDLSDGGFETGALAPSWAAVGDVQVATSATDLNQLATFTAPEGQFFARLTAGEVPDVYTTLSQTFTIGEASTLTFSANFVAYDGFGYNDDAYVRVFSLASDSYVFRSDVDTVGEYGWTDWRSFSLGLAASGVYTIEAGVRNVGDFGVADTIYSSQLLLDDVQLVAGAVPEPATWALMICGFGAAGAMLRRRPVAA